MPFLSKDDLSTHIYPEIMDAITRENDDLVQRALNSAIAEVKSYLSRFDLTALFGTADTEPTVAEHQLAHLKNLTKDVAAWHLIRLANPNISLELFRTIYEDAIKFLEKVMKGQADPDGWPYKPDNPETPANENTGIQWSSNRKRVQHF